jgi:hypothetical protein
MPMLVAGGGGGAGYGSTSNIYWGRRGSEFTNGTHCAYDNSGAAQSNCIEGRDGQGGQQRQSGDAGPGGGWFSDASCTYNRQLCGAGRPSWFAGGHPYQQAYVEGGYGGGGAAVQAGGGGGGFSGGAGGYSSFGGGGGGSYASGLLSGALRGGNIRDDGVVTFHRLAMDVNMAIFMSTCGASGRSGPTLAACNAAYNGTSAAPLISGIVSGVQRITVPSGGTWRITAYGAAGGFAKMNTLHKGGQGAKAQGEFELVAGETIRCVSHYFASLPATRALCYSACAHMSSATPFLLSAHC